MYHFIGVYIISFKYIFIVIIKILTKKINLLGVRVLFQILRTVPQYL